MQRVSPELSDQLVILLSYPWLLREDWADWRRWPSGGATQYFPYFRWSELLSFPPPLLILIVLSPRHWHNGISDDRIVRNSAAFSPQFDSKIHLVCNRKFRTTSFLIQNTGKINDREKFFLHTRQLSLNYWHIILHFLLHPIQCR